MADSTHDTDSGQVAADLPSSRLGDELRELGHYWAGSILYPQNAFAIAANRADEAAAASALRKFAEFVVSLDDDDPESPGRIARRTVHLNLLIVQARAALAAEAQS